MAPRARHILQLIVVGIAVVALHGARASDARGLFVGVAEYADSAVVPVPNAGADASALQAAVEAWKGTPGGLSLLAAGEESLEGPTRADILRGLAVLGEGITVSDLSIVYYGGQVATHDGAGFLLARDTDMSDLPGTAVSLKAVGEAFGQVKADNKLLVLSVATGAASPDDAFYEALVRMRDITVLVGCGAGEGLTLTDEGRDGFTHFLGEALGSSGDTLALRKLSYGVWDTTRRLAEGKGAKQTPQYMPVGRGEAPGSDAGDAADAELVVLETTQGRIVIELYEEDAPLHVANFKKLVREGFYEGDASAFHRYVKGFVIQGGDPLGHDSRRAGQGGPGYTIPAEIKRKHLKGAVAAARTGDRGNPERKSSGSQFYICLGRLFQLDRKYSVFGRVIEGMDAVMKLRAGDEMTKTSVILASDHTPAE
ncbi:MAG: peptidylprolyl isomerase [Candidatus Poribacteria bacterium]